MLGCKHNTKFYTFLKLYFTYPFAIKTSEILFGISGSSSKSVQSTNTESFSKFFTLSTVVGFCALL